MDNNHSKSCTKCKTEKTLENYYRNKNHSDGHHATCKKCWSYKKKSAPREIQDSSICSKCNIEKSNANYFQTKKFKCKVVRVKGAWNDMLVDYRFYSDINQHDLSIYLDRIQPYVKDKIETGFMKHKAVTIKLLAMVLYDELDTSGNVVGLRKQIFPSRLETISSIDTINSRVDL
jgi:hypothetical protein